LSFHIVNQRNISFLSFDGYDNPVNVILTSSQLLNVSEALFDASMILVSGLSKRTTSEGLQEAFSKFGEVVQG
jgi:hypothetical protein